MPPASPWTVWQPGGALRVPGPGECKGGQGGQSGQRVCGQGMAIGAHSRRHTCFCFFLFLLKFQPVSGRLVGGVAPRSGRRGLSHSPHFPLTWMPSGVATMQVVTIFMKSPCSTTPSSARIASAAALASLMGSFSK